MFVLFCPPLCQRTKHFPQQKVLNRLQTVCHSDGQPMLWTHDDLKLMTSLIRQFVSAADNHISAEYVQWHWIIQWSCYKYRASWMDGLIILVRIQAVTWFHPSPKYPPCSWSPLTLLFNVYRQLFPGIRWPIREVDNSPPSMTEFKNEWFCISSAHTSPCLFQVECYIYPYFFTFDLQK